MQIQNTSEPRVVLTGTVSKVVKTVDGNRAEIVLDAAEDLYREVRVEQPQIPFSLGEPVTLIILSGVKAHADSLSSETQNGARKD